MLPEDARELAQALFDFAEQIRYVAIYRQGELHSAQRPGLTGASSSESDRYEELIVNPTLVTLLRQRGNIDCGGLKYVVIRYGNFFELVVPLEDGHLSVGIQADAEPAALAESIIARFVEPPAA